MIHSKVKTVFFFIFFLLISNYLFSQRQYSFSMGSDYTYNSSYVNGGKFGFHLSGDIEFSFGKHISMSTGFSVRQLNFKTPDKSSEFYYFTGTSTASEYNDQQTSIIPGSVVIGDSVYNAYPDQILRDSLYFNSYWNNAENSLSSNFPKNYMLILLNIPIQLNLNILNNKLQISSGIAISSIIYARNTPDSKFIDPEATLFAEGDVSYNANSDFKSALINVNIGAKYKVFRNFYAGLSYERSITNISKLYSNMYLNNVSINLTYKLNK